MTTDTATAVIDQPQTGIAAPSGTPEPAADPASGVGTVGTLPSQDPDKPAGVTSDTGDETLSTDLLSAEQYAAAKDDPAQLRKALNRAWTQKTQQLAAERKALAAWNDVRQAFDSDPKGTLAALAQQYGMDLRDPTVHAETAAAASAGDEAVTLLRQALDEAGMGEMADKIAPAIRKLAEQAAGQATAPIRQHQEQLIKDSAQREAAAVMETFTKTHPDWKEHEPAMQALAQQFQPATNPKTGKPAMSELQYLEHLYFLATKDTHAEKAAAAAVERMRKAALAADSGRASAVNTDHVATKPAGRVGFKDAYAAAKRGETWN